MIAISRPVKSDFERLLRGESFVKVSVYYYIPDYRSIINEFIWETIDRSPKYPRVGRFLEYWNRSIEGVIADVEVHESKGFKVDTFKKIDFTFNCNAK